MPITALSQTVVRALGSSQVLTTPVSLVKELVENALDAHASSIVVEISSNTLDCIQVKDNGHGVAPEDREDVAKRYFTSKIRNMAELKELGGRYLGFRGEALASAAELAGGLEMVTRIDGEIAACRLFVGRTGQVLKQETTSHPIGTTVRVTKFLQNIPVRKEVALKNASRTLNEVKQLLRKYALARPTVRLSLKVDKGKSDKYNWIYAPGKHATVADAALNIFGTIESQQQHEVDILSSSDNENPFRFEAFLPRSSAESSLISNKGHFVSVDSRPVSCTKGTLKQVLTLYKEYVRLSALSGTTAATKIKDPLLCLNIVCPPASYDPNVEAAKDDVLFEDQTLLLNSVGRFFAGIYGPLKKDEPPVTSGKTKAARKTNAFELLLARRRPETDGIKDLPPLADIEVSAEQERDHPKRVNGGTGPEGLLDLSVAESTPNPEREQATDDGLFFEESSRSSETLPRWRSTMYDIDEDCFEEPVRDVRVGNNASDETINSTMMPERAPETQKGSTRPQVNSPPPSSISNSSPIKLSTPSSVLRPFQSPLVPSPGQQVEQPGQKLSITFPPTPSSSDRFSRAIPHTELLVQKQALNRARRTDSEAQSNGYTRSDPTIASNQSLRSDTTVSGGYALRGNQAIPSDGVSRSHHGEGFVSARSVPLNGAFLPSSITQRPVPVPTDQNARRRQRNIPAEPIPPVRDLTQTWLDIGSRGKANTRKTQPNMDIRDALAMTSYSSSSSNQAPTRSRNAIEDASGAFFKSSSHTVASAMPDLDELLDYERRKKAATERRRREKLLSHRGFVDGRPNDSDGNPLTMMMMTNSPHRNRYNAAIAALHHEPAQTQTDAGPPTTTFAPGDPRAYFIRLMAGSNNNNNHNLRNGQQDGGGVVRRPKMSMLPLETVPASLRLQNVSMRLGLPPPTTTTTTTLDWIEERLRREKAASRHDDARSTTAVFAADESALETQRRLSALVDLAYRREGEGAGEGEGEGAGTILRPNLTLDLQKSFRDFRVASSASSAVL
ncbi:MAG: hypothetical protein M1816_003201 [Peltula sp. TS41687]|nr:MAG: hypothetical protein M1816_003201 [Peltula sp. TS41687]